MGEVIPTAPTKTDEDLEPEFTYDEWVQEIADMVRPKTPPGIGWVQLGDIVASIREKDPEASFDTIRRRMTKEVQKGILEKWSAGKGCPAFYRIKAEENK